MANTNDSSDPLHAKNKAWSGRFSEPVADFVLRYTASVNFDKRMAKADINGSLAHAAMLEKAGVAAVMANGMPQIKALADLVTTADCDHDGVAEVFETLGL